MGSKFTHNALAAGALPRTPLEELKRSLRHPSLFQGTASRQGRERQGIGRTEGERKGRGGGGKEEKEEGGEREEIGGRTLLLNF